MAGIPLALVNVQNPCSSNHIKSARLCRCADSPDTFGCSGRLVRGEAARKAKVGSP
jgi:hypothetical protein